MKNIFGTVLENSYNILEYDIQEKLKNINVKNISVKNINYNESKTGLISMIDFSYLTEDTNCLNNLPSMVIIIVMIILFFHFLKKASMIFAKILLITLHVE